MSKIKEIISEKSTWLVGVPSLAVGVMTILDADHAQEVAGAISQAGQHYASSGDWVQAVGFLGMGLLGIFMKGR